jgi:hypothetical protein
LILTKNPSFRSGTNYQKKKGEIPPSFLKKKIQTST